MNASFRQVGGVSDWPEKRGCITVGQVPRVRVPKPGLRGGPTGCKRQCIAS